MNPSDPTGPHAPLPAASPDQQAYINGFSWGALLGAAVWAAGNRLWLWFILSLITPINIFVAIYLGIRGRRLSWDRGEWSSFDAFKNRQLVLAKIIGVIYLVLIVVYAVIALRIA